jgi:hypothetical protein
MNLNELADQLETASSISEVAKLVKEKVIPMLRTKELTDEEIIKELESEIERLQDQLNEFLVAKDLAILRKAQEK